MIIYILSSNDRIVTTLTILIGVPEGVDMVPYVPSWLRG